MVFVRVNGTPVVDSRDALVIAAADSCVKRTATFRSQPQSSPAIRPENLARKNLLERRRRAEGLHRRRFLSYGFEDFSGRSRSETSPAFNQCFRRASDAVDASVMSVTSTTHL